MGLFSHPRQEPLTDKLVLYAYAPSVRVRPAGIAPLLIVYADLMGTGDGRCIEAAKRLIEKWDIS